MLPSLDLPARGLTASKMLPGCAGTEPLGHKKSGKIGYSARTECFIQTTLIAKFTGQHGVTDFHCRAILGSILICD